MGDLCRARQIRDPVLRAAVTQHAISFFEGIDGGDQIIRAKAAREPVDISYSRLSVGVRRFADLFSTLLRIAQRDDQQRAVRALALDRASEGVQSDAASGFWINHDADH